jgi:hypothetical protein
LQGAEGNRSDGAIPSWLARGSLRVPLHATSSAGSHANRLTTRPSEMGRFPAQHRNCSQKGLALGRGPCPSVGWAARTQNVTPLTRSTSSKSTHSGSTMDLHKPDRWTASSLDTHILSGHAYHLWTSMSVRPILREHNPASRYAKLWLFDLFVNASRTSHTATTYCRLNLTR